MDREFPSSISMDVIGGPYLNLGAGKKQIDQAHPLGLETGWDADHDRLPVGDKSIGGIYMYHLLEHLERPAALLAECQRVLRFGGLINIVVPYGACHLSTQDMTHRCHFNEDSWDTLFHNQYYEHVRDGVTIDWQLEVVSNLIIGLKGQNLALVTQLQKRG
jgi:ubiquinone/menaquinone biosynthesis C-methylase UbiE